MKKSETQECTCLVSITRLSIWIYIIRVETPVVAATCEDAWWEHEKHQRVTRCSPTTLSVQQLRGGRLMLARLPLRETGGKRSHTQHLITRRQVRSDGSRQTALPTHRAWIQFLASDWSWRLRDGLKKKKKRWGGNLKGVMRFCNCWLRISNFTCSDYHTARWKTLIFSF